MDKFVDKNSLITALVKENYLPFNAKDSCLEILTANHFPERIKIALNSKDISFDIVITSDEGTFYWEFHEKQHRALSDSRLKRIYNAENNEVISVPRYFQRLVRDVWRFQNFDPYTIVWQDWFIENCYTYKPQLQSDLYEYSLQNCFSFSEFYNEFR